MPRGTPSNIGDERISKNGYLYRKTERGWILVHRLLAEERLGRHLCANEYAAFIDSDKTNFAPDNIEVRLRGRTSLRRRLALVEARLQAYGDLRDELEARIELQDSL